MSLPDNDAWRHLSYTEAVIRMQFQSDVINEALARRRLACLGYEGKRLDQTIEGWKADPMTRGVA